jgi:outer membrane protein assembly factor BamB
MAQGSTQRTYRFALGAALAAGAVALGLWAPTTRAGDWPQWRGPNRDARATDFKAPKTWPKELTQKWKVTVGDGVASPALVGDKLYVFSREAGAEVTRCLNAETNKELWKDRYDVEFQGKGDTGYQGPRSSPAVADGMVVTFGVNGTLSGLKADTGEKVWRIETGNKPRFHTACSPIIVDKTVVIQVGSEGTGGVSAYDLANGEVKWKWTDDGASYASPVLMTLGTTKMVVAETDKNIVAIGVQTGKTLWKIPYPLAAKGPGQYNASTPLVDAQTVIFSGIGRGTKAIKIEKKGDELTTKDFWSNKENSALFNTPVLKNGFVYGLAVNDNLFCVNAENGKTAWTHSITGRKGYGSVVDAGSVLFAITPTAGSKLIVFEPNEKEYNELASYKVSDSEVYAYPIATGNRIYIKDKNSVILWTVEEK